MGYTNSQLRLADSHKDLLEIKGCSFNLLYQSSLISMACVYWSSLAMVFLCALACLISCVTYSLHMVFMMLKK